MTDYPTIPGYRITDEIGRGGMATVFLAEQESLGRVVAIKVMAQMRADEEFTARFVREARTLAQLNHPGIITIYDAGAVENARYLVMEYIKGGDLAGEIRHSGALSPGRASEVFAQCAEALDHAHAQGFVHRDIKPENVLIRDSGAAAITDFGIARGQEHRLTKTGTMVGTPSYMSPEQIRDLEISGQSDQYSLGVVLYEMLVGEAPFRATESTALAMKHLMDPVPELPAALGGFQPILDRLLAKSPEQRYPDCRSADEAVKAAAGTSAPSTEVTAPHPVPTPDSTPRMAGSDDPTITTQPLTAPMQGPIGAAPAPTGAQPQPRRRGLLTAGICGVLAVAVGLVWYLQREPATPPAGPAAAAPPPTDKSVAVLPLTVLSTAADDGFLAAGLHDTLLTELARIRDLRVISRTSVQRYADTTLSLAEIGAELGVAHLVEASLQRAGERIRVNAQLVRAATDEHLWAEIFDRDLADVFALQDEMASAIATAVQVQMAPSEAEANTTAGSQDSEAIAAYLQARGLAQSGQIDEQKKALLAVTEAVQRDPQFGQAQALLSQLSSWFVFRGIDTSQERRKIALEAAQAAIRLTPNRGEAKLALGTYLYYVAKDYNAALPLFDEAVADLPSDGDAARLRAALFKRLGRWPEALAEIERAIRLDPGNRRAWSEIVAILWRTREVEKLEAALDAALRRFPGDSQLQTERAWARFNFNGDGTLLEEILNSLASQDNDSVCATSGRRYTLATTLGRHREAHHAVASCDVPVIPFSHGVLLPRQFFLASALLAAGETVTAQRLYAEADAQLEDFAADRPGNAMQLVAHAVSGAQIGRDGACEQAQEAVSLATAQGDAILVGDVRYFAAAALARCGRENDSLALLRTLLETASGQTGYSLGNDPNFAPLRDNPSFQALLDQSRRRLAGAAP